MKQKVSTDFAVSIIVIFASVLGVSFWYMGKQNVVENSITKTTPQVSVDTSQEIEGFEDMNAKGQVAADTVPSDWKTYRNEQYGFELRAPEELQELSDNDRIRTVASSTGKTYDAPSLTNGAQNPSIGIVKGWSDPSIDPFELKGVHSRIAANGLTWDVFYNPEGGMAECDSAQFQVLMPNGKDILILSASDERVCPGDPKHSISVDFLKNVVSAFKFVP